MTKYLVLILAVFLSGCANMTTGKAKVALQFGSVIGPYLPRLTFEVGFEQDNDVLDFEDRRNTP